MTPTIEDVLKKHGLQIGFKSTYAWDSIVAACKEWASLQTPSNEKYWRERCEAAEAHWENRNSENFENWQRLKSTPIPILTPCVELEKEVERLKGLISGQSYSIWKGCDSDLPFDEWNKLFISGNNL